MLDRTLTRRGFFSVTAGIVGSTVLRPAVPLAEAAPLNPQDWDSVRAQFDLDSRFIHLATFALAPHPRQVREAIARHRLGLDRNPFDYLRANEDDLDGAVRSAAARYLGGEPDQVALTNSTTMGLGLVYGGLRLRSGQEIITTEHDFYSTHEALRLRAARTGAIVRRITLYDNPGQASEAQIVDAIRRAVTPTTRAIALTWVHSSTGVKLPIRSIARTLADINRNREGEERILLCVDGVHALGVEEVRVTDLGSDVFIAGTHKWLFGPRGTGVIWMTREAGSVTVATIPTFDGPHIGAWIGRRNPSSAAPGPSMTPGGYQPFEHRWAAAEAFRFHQAIGPNRIANRTRGLARQLKEGLSAIRGVTVYTPLSEELSSGIVCFNVQGLPPGSVLARLRDEHRVIGSATPYATRYVRFGPSIVNTPQEIDRVLAAVRSIAG